MKISNQINADMSNSLLKKIIKSSLIIFPKDAHKYILNFLMKSGIKKNEIIIFQQIWSKTLIGLQSFGKFKNNNNNNNNNNDNSIDVELFCNEFITELSLSNHKILELINISLICFKLDQHRRTTSTVDMVTHSSLSSESTKYDIVNPIDTIRTLEALSNLGQELTTALIEVYNNKDDDEDEDDDAVAVVDDDNGDISMKTFDQHHINRYEEKRDYNNYAHSPTTTTATEEMFESIALFRRSLRGTRIAWQHNVNIDETHFYSPLDKLIHGYPRMIRGILGEIIKI